MTTAETESPTAVAKARFVRVSASKARRVIDLVRGKSVSEALDILRWAPQAASEPVAKVIASAAANAQNNDGLDPSTLVVSTVYADEGPTAKRIRPRAQGRALASCAGQQGRRGQEGAGEQGPGQEGCCREGPGQEGAREED